MAAQDWKPQRRRRPRQSARRALLLALRYFLFANVVCTNGSDIAPVCPSAKSPRSEALPILDRLFPNHALDSAWEASPLLSTVFPTLRLGPANEADKLLPAVGLGGVDDNDAAARSRRLAAFQSLFALSDAHEVLSQPGLVHTEDFQLVKKIVRDGQEWNGMPPERSMSSEMAVSLFDLGGFSLVMNAMQRRWGSIGSFSRAMQDETGCNYVSCNLYATPSVIEKRPQRPGDEPLPKTVPQRCGFELHWDWMDVFVMQISGSKLWSVATEPLVHLSTRDLKRKPTIEEMNEYLAKGRRYREFLLRPGDVLYIPRGFVHNASTVGPDAGIVSVSLYGKDSVRRYSNEDDALWMQPSLHLTFGIEHTCETTYEALLQHALHLFGKTDEGKKLAISGKQCGSQRDVLWYHVLALALSDVARRGCGGAREGFDEIPPYLADSWSGVSATKSNSSEEMDTSIPGKGKWERDSCILRRSVPRGAAWRDIATARLRKDAGSTICRSELENKSDDDPVLESYRASLNALRNLASPHAFSSFLRRLHKMGGEGTLNAYCVPLLRSWDVLHCPQEATDRISADEMLIAMQNFIQFARENFDRAFQHFESHLAEHRSKEWERDDIDLRGVGQRHGGKSFLDYLSE